MSEWVGLSIFTMGLSISVAPSHNLLELSHLYSGANTGPSYFIEQLGVSNQTL
jgi:hypothetical protein